MASTGLRIFQFHITRTQRFVSKMYSWKSACFPRNTPHAVSIEAAKENTNPKGALSVKQRSVVSAYLRAMMACRDTLDSYPLKRNVPFCSHLVCLAAAIVIQAIRKIETAVWTRNVPIVGWAHFQRPRSRLQREIMDFQIRTLFERLLLYLSRAGIEIDRTWPVGENGSLCGDLFDSRKSHFRR